MDGVRVFVSGGAGVIGRELVRMLRNVGAIVMVGDLKSRPTVFDETVLYRQGDLNTLTKEEMDRFKPEIFFHLAATFERSSESRGFWGENFQHNVLLSHHLMTICSSTASVKRVVYASSYLVYDPSIYLRASPLRKPVSLHESSSLNPRNLTGMAKLFHEKELSFLNSFGESSFTTVSARIFRGYGCGSRDIISRWVRALTDGKPISVFNEKGMFDYIFARDSAEGLMRLSESENSEPAVNLGSGHSRSVEDVVEILTRHFPDARIRVESNPAPFEASVADCSLLRNLTGWIPRIGLEQGIEEIVAWQAGGQEHGLIH